MFKRIKKIIYIKFKLWLGFKSLKYNYYDRRVLKLLFDSGLDWPGSEHFKEVFTKPEIWILIQIAKYRHRKYDRRMKKYLKLKDQLMIMD